MPYVFNIISLNNQVMFVDLYSYYCRTITLFKKKAFRTIYYFVGVIQEIGHCRSIIISFAKHKA